LTVDSGIVAIYGGIIASAGNTGTQTLIKNGAGELVLTGSNTFTGVTQVLAGTLSGTGSLVSSLTVGSGATVAPGLSGSGTFAVGAGSTLAGTLAVTVDTTGSGSSNLFSVGGLLELSVGSSTVDFSTLGTLDDPAYVFANYGTLNGTFASVSNLPTGYAIDYGYLGNFIALVPVPEPTTYAILSGAAMALLVLRRRRT
jgi:autotransporter-associated beta strand protein